MKKKIGLGIVAALLVMSAAVFAGNTGKKSDNTCPDRPGCICSKPKTEQTATVVKAPIVTNATTATAKKETCPNRPGCICK
jgi:hypothetical protein